MPSHPSRSYSFHLGIFIPQILLRDIWIPHKKPKAAKQIFGIGLGQLKQSGRGQIEMRNGSVWVLWKESHLQIINEWETAKLKLEDIQFWSSSTGDGPSNNIMFLCMYMYMYIMYLYIYMYRCIYIYTHLFVYTYTSNVISRYHLWKVPKPHLEM